MICISPYPFSLNEVHISSFLQKGIEGGLGCVREPRWGKCDFYYAGVALSARFFPFGGAANLGIEGSIKASSRGCKSSARFASWEDGGEGRRRGFLRFGLAGAAAVKWVIVPEPRPHSSHCALLATASKSLQGTILASQLLLIPPALRKKKKKQNKWDSLSLFKLLMMDGSTWKNPIFFFFLPVPSCSDAPEPHKNFLLFASIKLKMFWTS